ncbi:MAG: 3-oxoacyl-[acyl-carrier-protein] reductase [Clostridia bacterium]|nr:3-oxoacyl-[acyl-carrier-protein] reductase [Clostridia bacterium]
MSKLAFITGGTTGIGKEIACTLAREGFDVCINCRKAPIEFEELKKEIEANNVTCYFVQGDVSKFEDAEKMIKEIIEKFEKIDVLVNNAGITKDSLLMRMKKEDFEDVINVNLVGTFNITKCTVPYMMKQRQGRIINMASVVGVSGNAGQANYAASKAGIIGFTKSLAKELGSRNILVNAVAPGYIQTAMTEVLSDKVKDGIKEQIPLGKLGETKDVANLVKFLASADSSYITGQVIHVDGGMLI